MGVFVFVRVWSNCECQLRMLGVAYARSDCVYVEE